MFSFLSRILPLIICAATGLVFRACPLVVAPLLFLPILLFLLTLLVLLILLITRLLRVSLFAITLFTAYLRHRHTSADRHTSVKRGRLRAILIIICKNGERCGCTEKRCDRHSRYSLFFDHIYCCDN